MVSCWGNIQYGRLYENTLCGMLRAGVETFIVGLRIKIFL